LPHPHRPLPRNHTYHRCLFWFLVWIKIKDRYVVVFREWILNPPEGMFLSKGQSLWFVQIYSQSPGKSWNFIEKMNKIRYRIKYLSRYGGHQWWVVDHETTHGSTVQRSGSDRPSIKWYGGRKWVLAFETVFAQESLVTLRETGKIG